MRLKTSMIIALVTLIIGLIGGAVGGWYLFDLATLPNGFAYVGQTEYRDYSEIVVSPVVVPLRSAQDWMIEFDMDIGAFVEFSFNYKYYKAPYNLVNSLTSFQINSVLLDKADWLSVSDLIIDEGTYKHNFVYSNSFFAEGFLYCLEVTYSALTPLDSGGGGGYISDSAFCFVLTNKDNQFSKTFWEKISGFFIDYWMIVLPVGVTVIGLGSTIALVARKYKQYKTLEKKKEI